MAGNGGATRGRRHSSPSSADENPDTTSPGRGGASGTALGDAPSLTDLTGVFASAFTGPLQSLVDVAAEPWRELGNSLAASWTGIATALSDNYRSVLGTQLQQMMETYQTQLQEIAATTTANLPQAISSLQEAATNAQLVNSAELGDALAAVRQQAEEANTLVIQKLEEIRRTLIERSPGE